MKESQRSYRGALISHRHLQDINRHLHSTQNKGMNKPSKPLLNLSKPFLFYFAGVVCSQNSQEFCNVNSSKKKMERVPSFYKMTLIDGCNPRKLLYTVRYLISLIIAYTVWLFLEPLDFINKMGSTSKIHQPKLLKEHYPSHNKK